jgi:LmbE family N-acetylglucosaminyl deacetylase
VATNITYSRRTPRDIVTTPDPAEVFTDWKGAAECWLFVSPHDDDVVIGAGLTFQAGLVEGAQVHALVVTDGRMGYCRLEQRRNISKIRRVEAEKSYQLLGLPPDHLRFIGCPDGNLNAHCGRRFAAIGTTAEIEGAGGLENAITHALRQIRPNRLFLPTSADLHPDHKIVHEEVLVSIFHAQGSIWPELGTPIAELPKVYEFTCYCDFPEPPQIRIDATPAMLETKLQGISAYASQEQIESAVAIQRSVGAIEYIREIEFRLYEPQQYHALFARSS